MEYLKGLINGLRYIGFLTNWHKVLLLIRENMDRILSVKEMRVADEYTVNKLGITAEILTERAAAAVTGEIKRRFHGGRVLVCVGAGHNGDDGKLIAKMLSVKHGFSVAVMNVSCGMLKLFDRTFDIIVDCIFGTGLNRPVEGKYKQAIEMINSSGAYVVSCDIPSGLNGDTGKVMGVAVKANLTVAVQEYKLGHFINDGPDYCGEVVAKDIGISIWGEGFISRLSYQDVAQFFLPRKRNSHKGNYGKVVILGGSKSFPGSTLLSLSGLSALVTGTGYANLAIPDCIYAACATNCPECTISVLPDDGENLRFDPISLAKLMDYDAIAVGMGMGVTSENYKIICHLLNNYKGRLIIDADGLNTLARFGLDVIKGSKAQLVLTPHVGEFCRLSGLAKEQLTADPFACAKNFAAEYGVTLVLKSAATIITDGETTFLNTAGCAGMAKAGSGDVLSGIIAGLCVKNENLSLTAACACFLFGKSGEFAVKSKNEFSVTARDFVSALPEVISKVITE